MSYYEGMRNAAIEEPAQPEPKAIHFMVDGVNGIMTPPMTHKARREVGALLRRLQEGEMLGLPSSRPMPSIAASVHELRVVDEQHNWRVMYYIGRSHIVVLPVFDKKTETTPSDVKDICKKRLVIYKRLDSERIERIHEKEKQNDASGV